MKTHNTNRELTGAIILMSMLLVLTLHASALAEAPRLSQIQPEAFPDRAVAWLEQNEADPRAPYVLMDLIMLLDAHQHPQADAMKQRLLLSHFQSIPAQYVARAVGDAKAYRDFLLNLTDHHQTAVEQRPRQLLGPIHIGLRMHGGEFVNDTSFLITAVYAAHDAGQTELRDNLLNAFDDRDAPQTLRDLVALVLEDDTAAEAKLHALYQLDPSYKQPVLKLLRAHFAHRLAANDNRSPFASEMLARHAMEHKQWLEVLQYLREITNRHNHPEPARLLLWEAIAWQGRGQVDIAAEPLQKLIEDHPDSDWTATARAFRELTEHADEGPSLAVDWLIETLDRLEEGGFERVDLAIAGPEKRRRITGYLAIDAREEIGRLVVQRDGAILVAYEVTPDGTRLYADGEPRILRLPDRGPIPSPRFELVRQANGSYNFNLDGKMVPTLAEAAERAFAVLRSDVLANPESIDRLVRHTLASGGFTAPAAPTDDAPIHLRILRLKSADAPDFTHIHLRANADHTHHRLTFDNGAKAELHYGDRDAFTMRTIDWPNLPTVEAQQTDVMMLMMSRIMPMLMELLQDEADTLQ